MFNQFLRQWGILPSTNFNIHTCPSLSGKTAVITGGSDGIGADIVKHLLLNDIAQPAAPDRTDRVRFIACDTADLAAIDRIGKEILSTLTRLDFLFLNAARSFDPDYRLSYGVEITFATNHMGHFHLTQLLTPLLVASAPSRVVVTSSSLHMVVASKFGFDELVSPTPPTSRGPAWDSWYRYGRSKLANILFTRALAQHLPEGVVPNSFFPGSVPTEASAGWKYLIGEFGGSMVTVLLKLMGQTLEQGAATAMYLAVGDAEEVGRGNYFVPVAVKEETSLLAADKEWAEELWMWSAETVERALSSEDKGEGKDLDGGASVNIPSELGKDMNGSASVNVPNELLAHPVCLPPA
ncbi:uncharacterized protein LAJ45_05637 [Morchella importuna]|uniref:uncharacterized protein n=1 Tax=Morchella importuna TaxID=1174673 RepID=UPI001E8D15FB|nr:uncharacterized protein LAJ45_05637 [Morchella importuna]KAH8150425.1 hypothetical protein LAJ45_05637 [Morchella importuna]